MNQVFGCLLFMVQWQYETNVTLATIDTIQPYIGSFQDVVDQGYMPPMPPERFML